MNLGEGGGEQKVPGELHARATTPSNVIALPTHTALGVL